MDLSADVFWTPGQRVFLDIRVFDLNARRCMNLNIQKCFKKRDEKKMKRKGHTTNACYKLKMLPAIQLVFSAIGDKVENVKYFTRDLLN